MKAVDFSSFDVIDEECLVHPSTWKGRSVDVRVIAKVKAPDGTLYEANRVIRMKFSKVKENP